MAYMGNLTRGDRVRVTIEAEVRHGSSFGVDLTVGNGVVTIREESFPGVEFEKVEPPQPAFQVGDRVRVTRRQWDNVPEGATGTVIPCPNHPHVLNVMFDGVKGDDDTYTSGWAMGPSDVEKIEPEPEFEVFQPGDVVQDYEWDVSPTLLVKGGYVEFHEDGSPPEFFPYNEDVPEGHFTSQRFGRVDFPG